MGGKPDSPVIQNPVAKTFPENRGDASASEKEESPDNDHGGKNTDSKQKAVGQITRDLLRRLFSKTEYGAETHKQDGCTGYNAGSVSAV